MNRLPKQSNRKHQVMKYFYLVAVAVASAIVTAERVIHLNSDNFDAIVDGTRNVFVKFEASWCGPCKRMAPIMEQVARESFPNLDGDTILAAIDADAEEEIGARFNIEAFPTIKLFLKGRSHDDAIDYTGDRSAKNIFNFIKHYVSLNLDALSEEVRNEVPATPLTKILEELARVGPRARNNEMVTNYNQFMTNAFDKAIHPEQKVVNQKQKKHKSKKGKKSHNSPVAAAATQDNFPLVNASQAKSIIASAGSKPVVLIFFSPSKQKTPNFRFANFFFLILV